MKEKKLIPKNFMVSVILLAAISLISNAAPAEQSQCNPATQLNTSIPLSLKHNYIIFLDENDKIQSKLVEINGWLLLEGILKKDLEIPIDSDLSRAIDSFGHNKLIGWWPEKEMSLGKNYFPGKEPVWLYRDADDTSWIHHYYKNTIPEHITRNFVSMVPLPPDFKQLCSDAECDQKHIVRIWSETSWHNDIDLITTAALISTMNTNSALSKKIFEENKKLINFAIENREIDDYFKYFEPKSTGYFLLLYYDQEGSQFLTKKAKNILSSKLKNTLKELLAEPLVAQWGGGTEWIHDCMIYFLNEKIPKLMYQYTNQYWNMR